MSSSRNVAIMIETPAWRQTKGVYVGQLLPKTLCYFVMCAMLFSASCFSDPATYRAPAVSSETALSFVWRDVPKNDLYKIKQNLVFQGTEAENLSKGTFLYTIRGKVMLDDLAKGIDKVMSEEYECISIDTQKDYVLIEQPDGCPPKAILITSKSYSRLFRQSDFATPSELSKVLLQAVKDA